MQEFLVHHLNKKMIPSTPLSTVTRVHVYGMYVDACVCCMLGMQSHQLQR